VFEDLARCFGRENNKPIAYRFSKASQGSGAVLGYNIEV
jgi:hypothetical protein